MSATPFSSRVLNIGFLVALALAATAFCTAGLYLLRFADSTQQVVAQLMAAGQKGGAIAPENLELLQNGLAIHAYVARVLLVSCGMFISLAFGFLGFALFLVGASGQSDVAASSGSKFQLTLTNLAPGSIAIVAATILAALCATQSMPVNFNFGGEAVKSQVTSRAEALIKPKPATGQQEADPLAKSDPGTP